LAEAAAAVAAPTTAVVPAAADEISAAIVALFGNFGQEFQSLSVQAQAFHADFVGLMNAGAGAYLSSEVANAEQALANAVDAPAQAILGQSLRPSGLLGGGGTTGGSLIGGLTGGNTGLLSGLTGSTGLLRGLNVNTSGPGGLGSLGGNLSSILSGALPGLPAAEATFEISLSPELSGAGTGGTPYVTLIANTIANLQSLGTGWLADPFPFLRQIIANQTGYAQMVTTALAAGDLSPVFFAIPGDISQNISNVINTLTDTSISFGAQLDTSNLPDSLGNSTLTLNLGLPLALGIDAIGAPLNTLSAFATSEAAFTTALKSGDFAGALTALVDAPAVVANGFLNGHTTWALQQSFSTDLAIPVEGVTVTIPVSEQAMIGIPLGGILTPLAPLQAVVGPITIGPTTVPEFTIPIPDLTVGPFPVVIPLPPPFPPFTYTIPALTIPIPDVTVGPFTIPPVTYGPYPFTVQGTPIGGIIPALVNYAPQQLAIAIGAPA
jgi:hypothetical protein